MKKKSKFDRRRQIFASVVEVVLVLAMVVPMVLSLVL